jgi:hypothetical protein
MMRNVAITGSADTVNQWFVDRQSGRWAQQTIGAAMPSRPPEAQWPRAVAATPPPPPRAETERRLASLHERGLLTDAELQRLRADLGG